MVKIPVDCHLQDEMGSTIFICICSSFRIREIELTHNGMIPNGMGLTKKQRPLALSKAKLGRGLHNTHTHTSVLQKPWKPLPCCAFAAEIRSSFFVCEALNGSSKQAVTFSLNCSINGALQSQLWHCPGWTFLGEILIFNTKAHLFSHYALQILFSWDQTMVTYKGCLPLWGKKALQILPDK